MSARAWRPLSTLGIWGAFFTGTAGACGVIPSDLLGYTHQAEVAYGLPQNLLVSLVWAESRYCVRAENTGSGAVGLGQLLPGTASDMGVADRLNPVQNLYGSARYLRLMWDTFRDWNRAVLAYHDGPGNVGAGHASPAGQRHVAVVLGTYAAIQKQGGLRW